MRSSPACVPARTVARACTALATAGLVVAAPSAADTKQPLPYYASISGAKARMRTGPARTYPANWLYQRPDLPVRVIAVFKEWRKVEDPDGTQGWMQSNLVSATRTAVIHALRPVAMLERSTPGARVMWRAANGVVGRISHCGGGWCRIDVKGQVGFVEVGALWGVEPGEVVP